MKNRFLLTALILGSSLYAETLYLDDLVKEAILNSPDIKISKADYEASSQRSRQVDADYLPRVDLSAYAGKQGVDYGEQKIGLPENEITPGNTETNLLGAKVSAKQLIYDFGKTTGNMESFENQSFAYKASLQQSISDKIYIVKKAYYTLLYNHALLDVNSENIKLNEQQLNRSEKYFTAGIRTKVDITDARVNLIEAQLNLQDTKHNIKLSLVDLKKEIGINSIRQTDSTDIFIQKPQSHDVYQSLPKITLPLSEYEQEAYSNRAELEQYVQFLKSAQSRYKQVNGEYYPSLYANGDYLIQDVDEDAFAPEEQWKAIVSLEWNLYSGSKTNAQNEEMRIIIMRAQADLDNARLRIQKEVSDAYIHVSKQLDSTKLSESLSVAAKEKFRQVQKRYEHGLADYIELQQARQSYIDSRARLTQNYYEYYTAIAQLDHAVGK